MSSLLLYMCFSILEGLVIFFLMFSFFGLKYLDNFIKVSCVAVIISVSMFFVHQYEGLIDLAPFINLLLLILALHFIFKVSIINSLYVSVVSILFLLCLQSTLIMIATNFINIDLKQIQQNIGFLGLFQLVECTILLILAYLNKKLQNKKFRFQFNIQKMKYYTKTINNTLLLFMSVIGIAMIAMFSDQPLRLGIIFISTCLFTLLYLGIKSKN